MRQLNGQDASFIYMECDSAHLHLTSVHIYDRSTVPVALKLDDIRRYIKSRMHTTPIYHQKLVIVPLNLDYPYWVDDDEFDADAHIYNLVLPEPGSWRQLCDAVAEIHSKPLDLTRPAWDMHIIEGLDGIDGIPADSFALVSRYHHAAIDGVSGTAVLTGLHHLTPEYDPDPQPQPWSPKPAPTWLELLNRATINSVRVPFQFAKTAASTIPGVSRAILRNLLDDVEASDKVPDTPFNAEVSANRAFDAVSFPMKDLAAIRNSVPGATVNDVLLTICGGALRQYLTSRNELPKESLVAMAPINTRTDADADTGGNVIATMTVPVHSDIEDPVSRLRAVHQATIDEKESEHAISSRQLTDLQQNIPAATEAVASRLITGLGLGHRGVRFANCTVSNVPGPPQTLYFNGAKMLQMMGVGPVVDGLGLMFTAVSYDGNIAVTISGCLKSTPDPEFLADCLRSSYAKLQKASAPPEKKSS